MSTAPPDPLKKGANLYDRIDYLVRAALWLVIESLNTRHSLENIVASTAELQVKLDALTAANAENASRTSDEIADLADALSKIVPGEPVSQAQLDQVQAVVDAMMARNTALSADDEPPVPNV